MIALEAIGHVRSSRRELLDDDRNSVAATIQLTDDFAPVRQPAWSHELMREYWKAGDV